MHADVRQLAVGSAEPRVLSVLDFVAVIELACSGFSSSVISSRLDYPRTISIAFRILGRLGGRNSSVRCRT